MAKRLIPTLNRGFPSKPSGGITLNTAKVVAAGLDGNDYLLGKKEQHIGASQACHTKVGTLCDSEYSSETCQFRHVLSSRYCPWSNGFRGSTSSLVKWSTGSRGLSSQAGSNEEDSTECELSELGSPSSDVVTEEKAMEENDKGSETENSDEDEAEVSQGEYEFLDTEQAATSKVSSKKRFSSALYKLILGSTRKSLDRDLDVWDAEGKPFNQSEISLCLLNLRKGRMFGKALQFLEWLQSKQKIEFTERNYASLLDLIAKVRGIHHAERYIENIPESLRGEVIYRTLLTNCATSNNMKKAEEVFNKMQKLGVQITPFTCNMLLLLYKKLDKKKIPDILLFMEKENIKPTLFTYNLLIDTKGLSNDITGMEQLLKTMKEQGFEHDVSIRAIVARHYIRAGLIEKAEAVLKEMEGGNLKPTRGVCRCLLPLYAELGKAVDVDRVWKLCNQNPGKEECLAAIRAWGTLGNIEEAEAVFDRMGQKWERLRGRDYNTLFKVYADHKLPTKGDDLAKRMLADRNIRIDPRICDALVKHYVEGGDLEKAASILQKAAWNKRARPLFISYMHVMDEYAKRGDVHNTEKLFHLLRQAGYEGSPQSYEALLDAYIKAKAHAYGFRERLRADNIYPGRYASKLAQIDAFRKKPVSDLLD